ncbi:MAG: SDR family NAD(P)-dependent oxidoreductase [Planctomycetota bacterium]
MTKWMLLTGASQGFGAGLAQRLSAHRARRIITIVSCASQAPIPTLGIYGSSKTALVIMANIMQFELKPLGVDILNIYSGTVDTEFEPHACLLLFLRHRCESVFGRHKKKYQGGNERNLNVHENDRLWF